MKRAFSFAIAFIVVGCMTDNDLKQWYVPMNLDKRPAVAVDHVEFLDRLPVDRPYIVAGTIAPPRSEFDTWEDEVKAIRRIAALYGADAIYLEPESIGKLDRRLTARAIVWKDQP